MLRFRKLPLAKKFIDKRRGKGNIKICRRNFFVSHCRKTSYTNPPVFHYFRISKTFMLQRVVSRFSVEYFCLTVPKFSVGKPFSVSLISGIEKVWIRGGGGGGGWSIKFLRRKFFVSGC